jgi:hypothetical protein
MAVWKPFYIYCHCGHRNRPHNSPREGVRLALLQQLKPCTSCGQALPTALPDRPLVTQVKAELVAKGLLPAT